MQKAVLVLDARKTRRGPQLVRREVRTTDFAHLARPDQPVERTERVLDGRRGTGVMELVEIDAVGPQATQTVLNCLPHVNGPRALPALVHLQAKLRGDDRLAP